MQAERFAEAADAFRKVLQQIPAHQDAHDGLVEAIRGRSLFARALHGLANLQGKGFTSVAGFVSLMALQVFWRTSTRAAGYPAYLVVPGGLVAALFVCLPWAVPGLEIISLWADRYGRTVITSLGKAIAATMAAGLLLGLGLGVAGAVANQGPLGFWGICTWALLPALSWGLLSAELLRPTWAFKALVGAAALAWALQGVAVIGGLAPVSYWAGGAVISLVAVAIGWVMVWVNKQPG